MQKKICQQPEFVTNLGFVMTATFNYEHPLLKVSIYKTGKQYDYNIKAKLIPKCFHCRITPLLQKKSKQLRTKEH